MTCVIYAVSRRNRTSYQECLPPTVSPLTSQIKAGYHTALSRRQRFKPNLCQFLLSSFPKTNSCRAPICSSLLLPLLWSEALSQRGSRVTTHQCLTQCTCCMYGLTSGTMDGVEVKNVIYNLEKSDRRTHNVPRGWRAENQRHTFIYTGT